MGGKASKDTIPEVFDEDWRKIPMSKNQYLDYIRNYQLRHDGIQRVRILVHGPIGAGKSSFINSVDTVLQDRMAGRALPDGIGVNTFTTEFRTFKTQKEETQGTLYPFVFTDIMGVERGTNRGVSVEDIKLAMKGHLRDKYKFCAAMGGKTSQPVDTIPNRMGRSQSKDIILDAFEQDWRKIPMSKNQYLDYVKNYQLHHDEIQHLRILLHGPTGAGKSSFINSVDTVLQGRMAGRALTDGIGVDTFSTEYRTFKIQKEAQGTFYPFVFTDIMGLEKDTNRGVSVEDIKLAMKGHVKDKYKFNPSAPVSEEDNGFNKTPSLTDQVHVLVCVISAHAVSVINPEAIRKMRDVRLAARDLGIPQLAVLTKIDAACPVVKEDVGNVYKSVKVKQLMERLSAELGIPLYCIFPVKNYHWEIAPEDVSDRLILSALKQMIDFGDDFVNNHM